MSIRRSEEPFDLIGGHGVVGADRTGGAEGGAAAEDRQPLEHDPFRLIEEVVAPVGNRLQVSLVGTRNSRVVSQHVEAVGEAFEDLAEAHVSGSSCCELESERQPVEPFADLGDHVRAHITVGHEPGDALFEEADRGRQRQWADGEQQLATDAEALAAGGDESELGASAEQLLDEEIDGAEQVLAVVEH